MGAIGELSQGLGNMGEPVGIPAWAEGEIFPACKDWENAPVDLGSCEHEGGVVIPQERGPRVANPGNGTIAVHCMNCDLTWWEPLSNIKGSPWEGK